MPTFFHMLTDIRMESRALLTDAPLIALWIAGPVPSVRTTAGKTRRKEAGTSMAALVRTAIVAGGA